MDPRQFSALSRRQFIRQATCAAVGTAAMTSAIRDLRFMNAAVAQSNITDYKALVCIFLAGGNDCNNTLIPLSASTDLTGGYSAYQTTRNAGNAGLAIAQNKLLPLSPTPPSGGGGRAPGWCPGRRG